MGRNKIGYTAPEGLIRKPGSSCWYIKVGIGKYKSTGTSDINIAKAILSRMKGERHLSLVRGNDTPGEISDGIVCKIINESKESFPVKPLPPFKKGFYEKLRVPKEERRHTGNHHRTIESLSRKLEGAKTVGFTNSVVTAVAKWRVIQELRKEGIIGEDVVPDKRIIQKELRKPLCAECAYDADSCPCGCNAERTTMLEIAKDELERELHIRPDLYIIDEEKPKITIIEVEDTSRVSLIKLHEYAYFWDAVLDASRCEDFEVNLFIYDRFGNKMGAMNLEIYYNAAITMIEYDEDEYISQLEKKEEVGPRIESEILGYYRKARVRRNKQT